MPESSPHRYPTHFLPYNHCHHMCTCVDIGSQKPMKFKVVWQDTKFHWFYVLNFRQRPSIIEICRNQVHTGTPHILCLTSTAITCVFVKQIGIRKPLKFTTIHTVWTFHCFYTLNFRQSPSIIEIWLQAMCQARRSWLMRLLTVHTPPPRMSQRGHHKSTCEIGARKRYVKTRNLMSVTSPEYVLVDNASDTT